MPTVTDDDLERLFNLLRVSPESFSSEKRLQAAVKLFAAGRVSSGKAAELAGIPRVVFLHRLAEFDVPVIDLTFEELEQDVKNALE
ncbi:MAG: UPF0175 family protein [Chloroflexota bacterium]|nr:MAG: UPF0175 family protein [Chloroflexota bacterium]